MQANFNKVFIIVVAPDNKVYNSKYTKSMSGSRFRSLIVQYYMRGAPLIPVSSVREGIRVVQSICKYAGDEQCINNGLKRVAPRTDDKYVDMLCVCDGVGPKTARDILKVFKVYELWDITEKDLVNSVKGVGKVSASNIKKVFRK
jgi:ERCC4-type nuclease